MIWPMSEQASYYPYWSRVLLEARIFGAIVVLELGVIAWQLWRGHPSQ